MWDELSCLLNAGGYPQILILGKVKVIEGFLCLLYSLVPVTHAFFGKCFICRNENYMVLSRESCET
jgi:hypothetical protein